MSCATLTTSRTMPCNTSISGVRAVAFGVYKPLDRIVTTVSGVTDVASIYGAGTLARFEVKNTTAKYLENASKGADTNAKIVKGTFTLTLAIAPDLDDHLAVSKIADTLMDRQWVVFIEMKDGTILCAGTQNGADVLTIDGDTGGGGNDLNGFTVNITTEEPEFARKYVLSGAAITEYATALIA